MRQRGLRSSWCARVGTSVDTRTVGSVSIDLRIVGAAEAELVQEFHRLAAQVAEGRERATRLRALADHAGAQAERDERVLDEIGAVVGLTSQMRLEDGDPRLRGPRLEAVAVDVLQNADAGDEGIHYREWFALLRSAGHHVGGKDPLATFLSQINRSRAVERIGQRTGRYRLRAVA